ncbi:MAG: hypothetical protein NVSMB25_07810 [Thermoleophilaceae bacterium]
MDAETKGSDGDLAAASRTAFSRSRSRGTGLILCPPPGGRETRSQYVRVPRNAGILIEIRRRER